MRMLSPISKLYAMPRHCVAEVCCVVWWTREKFSNHHGLNTRQPKGPRPIVVTNPTGEVGSPV